jgi:hypothetical protein
MGLASGEEAAPTSWLQTGSLAGGREEVEEEEGRMVMAVVSGDTGEEGETAREREERKRSKRGLQRAGGGFIIALLRGEDK